MNYFFEVTYPTLIDWHFPENSRTGRPTAGAPFSAQMRAGSQFLFVSCLLVTFLSFFSSFAGIYLEKYLVN